MTVRGLFILENKNGGHTIRVAADSGMTEFSVPIESGEFMQVMACGADREYSINGQRHDHYVLFTHDMWVFDGKYLTRLGSKKP